MHVFTNGPRLLVAALVVVAIAGAAPAQPAPAAGDAALVTTDTATNCADLTGAAEVPAVAGAGTGTGWLLLDGAAGTIHWWVGFDGLSGPAIGASLHGPAAAGTTGPVVVDLAMTGAPFGSPLSGEAAVTAAQAEEIRAGQWYVNVRTAAHPEGEIRGQLTGIPVAEGMVRGEPAAQVPMAVAAAEMADPQACALALDFTENPVATTAPATGR